MINEPVVYVLDIETAPMEAYVWGRRDQNISLDQIKRDWFIMAFSAKKLGAALGAAIYRSTEGREWGDDKALLKDLWNILDEADILVTQNGLRFDSRKITARLILCGFKPPSPYRHIDTYKYLSRIADFTSASLDYLTSRICTKYKKLSHKKFPGWKLWVECLKDNKAAWAEMKRYNIHDILSTEELYLKTKAWAPRSVPNAHAVIGLDRKCGRCGKFALVCRGTETTNKGRYQKMHCKLCGAWPKGEKI